MINLPAFCSRSRILFLQPPTLHCTIWIFRKNERINVCTKPRYRDWFFYKPMYEHTPNHDCRAMQLIQIYGDNVDINLEVSQSWPPSETSYSTTRKIQYSEVTILCTEMPYRLISISCGKIQHAYCFQGIKRAVIHASRESCHYVNTY